MRRDAVKIVFVVPADNCEYIGIGLLSSCLKARGIHNVSVVPAKIEKIEKVAVGADFVIVAFSPFAFCSDDFARVAAVIKRRHPEYLCVFGGPHVTFAPEIIMSEGVDAVCRGEAEEAFPEFVMKAIETDRDLPSGLKNWWLKRGDGTIEKNETRPVITDLDALPFSDKSLFTNTLFFKRGFRRFIFSRGCLFRCAYCAVPAYERICEGGARHRRTRSVENALSEIKEVLRKYGGTAIGIIDSVFGPHMEWLEKFAYEYKRQIGKPFYCHTEVSLASERYVSLLKEAGCYFTLMGLECGNETVRRSILNKHFTNSQFEAAAARIKGKGIRLGVYNIIGIPDSVFDDDLMTLELNQKAAPYFVESHVFSMYPGTALYDKYKGRLKVKMSPHESVYWSPVTSRSLRPDLSRVMRLHYLFNIMARWKVPAAVAGVVVALPLDFLYRAIARFFARGHYRLYDP